jgi:hypothetical protein
MANWATRRATERAARNAYLPETMFLAAEHYARGGAHPMLRDPVWSPEWWGRTAPAGNGSRAGLGR